MRIKVLQIFRIICVILLLPVLLLPLITCDNENQHEQNENKDKDDNTPSAVSGVSGFDDGPWTNSREANDYVDEKCSESQNPPAGYFPYEASWLLVRFDDPETPIKGIYAYFWIDWFMFEGCSYSAVQSVIYLDQLGVDNLLSDGGTFTDIDIRYLSETPYNIFVDPYLHVKSVKGDPTLFNIKIMGEGYSGNLDIRISNFLYWSDRWYTFYDAFVENASVTIGSETYFPQKGKATLERWFNIGGSDPLKADLVNGYWLYALMYWEDEQGRGVDTLTYFWVTENHGETVVGIAEGIVSTDTVTIKILYVIPEFDFIENQNSDGYLRKHRITAFLENGETLTYLVEVENEYIDRFNEPWSDLLPDDGRRESHSLVTGTMEYEDVTYTGGGIFEWKTSDINPLMP